MNLFYFCYLYDICKDNANISQVGCERLQKTTLSDGLKSLYLQTRSPCRTRVFSGANQMWLPWLRHDCPCRFSTREYSCLVIFFRLNYMKVTDLSFENYFSLTDLSLNCGFCFIFVLSVFEFLKYTILFQKKYSDPTKFLVKIFVLGYLELNKVFF